MSRCLVVVVFDFRLCGMISFARGETEVVIGDDEEDDEEDMIGVVVELAMFSCSDEGMEVVMVLETILLLIATFAADKEGEGVVCCSSELDVGVGDDGGDDGVFVAEIDKTFVIPVVFDGRVETSLFNNGDDTEGDFFLFSSISEIAISGVEVVEIVSCWKSLLILMLLLSFIMTCSTTFDGDCVGIGGDVFDIFGDKDFTISIVPLILALLWCCCIGVVDVVSGLCSGF